MGFHVGHEGTAVCHHGPVMGFFALAEFESAVDAVQCAVEAQAAFTEAIASRPVDKRINFRIGIHIGDVMGRGGVSGGFYFK
jgi:class 3 adenylate cyclase